MSKSVSKQRNSRRLLAVSALSLLIAGVLGAASPAFAVPKPGKTSVYKADFTDMTQINARVLDWRTHSVDVYFDVPDSDWIDGIELLVTAHPDGPVSPRTPIMVRFNGGEGIPIYSDGLGFDARVELNKSRIRPRRNKITFEYRSPAGTQCLTEDNGQWTLDFEKSSIVVKARSKTRDFQIRELEERFAMPAAAPKSVSLIAKGPQASKLQMLAAQGIGLRAADLPDFTTVRGGSDLEVIMGRRDELRGLIRNKEIFKDHGARASLDTGRPMRLVLTGDTDTEVMEMAKAFAQHTLPKTRRTKTSMGETLLQPDFHMQNVVVRKKAKLSSLPGQIIGRDWGTAAQTHTFSVEDPLVSSGRVVLRLSSSKFVSKDSRVEVKLNDKSLGYTPLNQIRKSVAFNIPEGSLHATGNRLEILPTLGRKETADICGYNAALPGFIIGDGSKIELKTSYTSPATELSRFAATGGSFAADNGAETQIILSSSSTPNKGAALKVLAQLAKVSGHSWSEADISSAANFDFVGSDKNLLVIGPKTSRTNTLLQAGPKSLSAALRGDMLRSGAYQTASIETFASHDEADILNMYAARQEQNSRITRGGIAALYPSPADETRLVAVITSSAGQSFPKAADQLLRDDHWNQLAGSVTRWNHTNVLMAQTAVPETGAMRLAAMEAAQTPVPGADWAASLWDGAAKEARTLTSAAQDKFAEIRASIKDRLSKPLQAEMPGASDKSTAEAVPTPRVKPAGQAASSAMAAVPELRGLSKVPAAQKTASTGFDMPKFIMPELETPNIKWDLVKANFDRPESWKIVKWSRTKWTALNTEHPEAFNFVTLRKNTALHARSIRAKADRHVAWAEARIGRPALLAILAFFFLLGLLSFGGNKRKTRF